MKKLLSINLGITSIGYSVLNELDNDKYSRNLIMVLICLILLMTKMEIQKN